MRSLLLSLALVLTLVTGCSSKSNPAPSTGHGSDSGSGAAIGSDTGSGSIVGSGAAIGSGSGAATEEECRVTECGPRPGMPVRKCDDGSLGGNTGRCLRRADGACGWEIRTCPPPGNPAR
jgi:hypothetical protein